MIHKNIIYLCAHFLQSLHVHFPKSLQGLKLMQKAKKNSIDIGSRQSGTLKPINMRRMFTNVDDEDEVDEVADLEKRIKLVKIEWCKLKR